MIEIMSILNDLIDFDLLNEIDFDSVDDSVEDSVEDSVDDSVQSFTQNNQSFGFDKSSDFNINATQSLINKSHEDNYYFNNDNQLSHYANNFFCNERNILFGNLSVNHNYDANDATNNDIDCCFNDKLHPTYANNGEQTQDNISGEQTQDNISEEQTQDNISGDQTQDNISGEQTQDNITEEQTQDNITEEQTQDNISRDQTQDNISGEQTQDNITEEQTQDNISRDQTQDKISGDQTQDNISGEQTQDNISEEQTQDNISEEQTQDNICGELVKPQDFIEQNSCLLIRSPIEEKSNEVIKTLTGKEYGLNDKSKGCVNTTIVEKCNEKDRNSEELLNRLQKMKEKTRERRERNRIAAKKCREKKLNAIKCLENNKMALIQKNQEFETKLSAKRLEIIQMRMSLLHHKYRECLLKNRNKSSII